MKRRAPGRSRWRASWMYEKGVRCHWGDPYVLLTVCDRFGKPGWRWMLLDLYPPDGTDHWEQLEWGAETLLRKDSLTRAAEAGVVTVVDVKAQKMWPTLWTYLTQTKWEDDTPRPTSGLTIFLQDGLFKVLLKENAESLCLWAAGTSFFGALDALEAALGTPQPDWRVDRRAGGGVAKKGRK